MQEVGKQLRRHGDVAQVLASCGMQGVEGFGNIIGHAMRFERAPKQFNGIAFGGIGRDRLDLEAAGSLQQTPNCRTAVHAAVVPDHDEPSASQMAKQLPQEPGHTLMIDRLVFMQGEEQPRFAPQR